MKESFIVRKKYQEQINLLNTEQKAQLLDAIFSYQSTLTLPENLDPLVSMLLSIMIAERTKDDQKYSETLQKRIEGGKKGGRPNKDWGNSQKPGGLEKNLKGGKETSSPPVYDSDSVSDSVNVDDNDSITSSNEEVNKNKINNKNKTKKNGYSSEFEEFWKAYPLKKGKQKAFKAWTEALKGGYDPNLIIKKAGEYTLEIKHKKTEKSYIKRAQGWLNDGRWDDEYDIGTTGKKPDLNDLY
ncbi:MAG: superinfection exclusion B family protein [candidate division SR1 bacterium]|nr:superinfection exclusion B family protein [candidate division SR1 bacterium]